MYRGTMQLLYRIQCKQQMNWQRPSKALLFFGNHAIEAVFPKTEVQNCIIHQLRNSSKYVSYKDIKALMADLKAVYAAVDEATALGNSGYLFRALGQEIPQNLSVLAG